MNKFNGFLVFCNILLIIITIGAYVAPYFHPKDSVFFAIIGLGFPALLMANIAFIIYWLLVKIRNSWGSTLALLVGFSPILNVVNISSPTSPSSTDTILEVANYNMQFSKPVRSTSGRHQLITEADFKQYLQQFKQLDIVCFQEHSTYAQWHIGQQLKLPYYYAARGGFVAIYSKYPIIDKGQLPDFSTSPATVCIWADIKVKEDTIRVYAAHFEANRKDGKVPKKVDETAKEAPVDLSIATGILKHYQTFTSKRVDQAKRLNELFQKSPYPTILCGDINDTPQTHVYKILQEGKKDTFREKGVGLGATFGSTFKNKLALLRIDYILTHPAFEILDHQIFPAPYSDHYLISSKMQLP